MENKRIMFVGPSGIGKTTLAKFISEQYGIPFISGSYSDLVPSTREVRHEEMMEKPFSVLYNEEQKLFFKRANTFGECSANNASFVSDRSYVDNMAYFIYKLSAHLPKCETESFEDVVKHALERDCTHIIYMKCTNDILDSWVVEDNNKRILNPYFQWMISNIMGELLTRWSSTGFIQDVGISVLTLNSRDLVTNQKAIKKFLKWN